MTARVMINSKAKGAGYELEIVKKHAGIGIHAEKMPLSGALGGKYSGDIQVAGLIGECKRRKRGFTQLYKALEQGGGSDLLFIRDDNRESLIVLPWRTYSLFLEWLDWANKYPKGKAQEDD